MKKILKKIWPFLHAWLGLVVIGTLGRIIYVLCFPAFKHFPAGIDNYLQNWDYEYSLATIIAMLPGVLYASFVAAAAKTKRKTALIIFVTFFIQAYITTYSYLTTTNNGITLYPVLSVVLVLIAIGFIVSLCVALCLQGKNRKTRIISGPIVIAVSFIAVTFIPEAMITLHKTSFNKNNAKLMTLDQESDEHFRLRMMNELHKNSLVALGYLCKLEYIPDVKYNKDQLDILCDETIALAKTNKTTDVSFEIPQRPSEYSMGIITIWDVRNKQEFWDDFASERSLEKVSY